MESVKNLKAVSEQEQHEPVVKHDTLPIRTLQNVTENETVAHGLSMFCKQYFLMSMEMRKMKDLIK